MQSDVLSQTVFLLCSKERIGVRYEWSEKEWKEVILPATGAIRDQLQSWKKRM